MVRRVGAWILAGALLCCGAACGSPPGEQDQVAGATPTASTPGARSFSSSQYALELLLPQGWSASPAVRPWGGGDIDHTAPYADRLYGPEHTVFVIGEPTRRGLQAYTDAHAAWLSESRGCPAPATERAATVDGAPARLLVIHCPQGPFGRTLVLKAVTVTKGRALVVTSFTPDGDQAADLADFVALIGTITWDRTG